MQKECQSNVKMVVMMKMSSIKMTVKAFVELVMIRKKGSDNGRKEEM